MALNNATTSTTSIYGRSKESSAVSEVLTQETVEADYRNIKRMRSWQYLESISDVTSSSNTLVTARPFTNGETLLIRLADGTLHNFVVDTANVITAPGVNLIPKMYANDNPSGILSTNNTNIGSTLYRGFDRSSATRTNHPGVAYWIQYEFEDLVPHHATHFSINLLNQGSEALTVNGSTNGIDWIELGAYSIENGTVELTSPGSYSFYRVVFATSTYYIYDCTLIGNGYQIDVSSITQGETPTQVYREITTYVNEVELTKDSSRLFHAISGSTLRTINVHDDVTFDAAREYTTTFEFNAIGNKVTELTGELYTIELESGTFVHTSNVLPGNVVSVGGADAGTVEDAYKVFDGDIVTNAFSAVTGAEGVVDIWHKYDFGVATTVYEFVMLTGAYAGTPAIVQVLASNDDSAYDVILDMEQDISVDNLELKRRIATDVSGPYRYYKIHVTKGNVADSTVSVVEYKLMTEV